ncbi:hypothetical protein UT300012_24340 [Paraclostridium bifermentans]
MNVAIIVVTIIYLVGIFYRRCYKDIQKYKDRIGYTEDMEYINKYTEKIKEYSRKEVD